MNLKLDQFIGVSESDMNLYNEIIDIFISAQSEAYVLHQQISSIEMLYSVAQHIRKFGITEENRELFAASFEQIGISYSYEGIIRTAYDSVKKFIERIIKFLKEKAQAFFKKIKEWYNRIFHKKVQEASKTPFPKEKADEFNKKMAASSKSSSNESASFTELANAVDIQSDQGGNRFVYIDDLIHNSSLQLSIFKHVVSDLANNKVPNIPDIVGLRFGTAYEGGWADPAKIDKFLSIMSDLSDATEEVIIGLHQIAARLEKGTLQLNDDVLKEIKAGFEELPKVLVQVRISIRLAKNAIEIRESLMKDQIPD